MKRFVLGVGHAEFIPSEWGGKGPQGIKMTSPGGELIHLLKEPKKLPKKAYRLVLEEVKESPRGK